MGWARCVATLTTTSLSAGGATLPKWARRCLASGRLAGVLQMGRCCWIATTWTTPVPRLSWRSFEEHEDVVSSSTDRWPGACLDGSDCTGLCPLGSGIAVDVADSLAARVGERPFLLLTGSLQDSAGLAVSISR